MREDVWRRAGIPERWGYRSDWRAPLLTRAVERPRRGHQADYYQRLVASLGFANGPQRPQLTVPALVRSAAAAMCPGDVLAKIKK